MTRLVAASLAVLIALTFVSAQPAAGKNSIAATKDADGAWTWTLPASGSIRINDLLGLYGSCRDVTVIVDERKMQGDISYHTAEGTTLTGEQIDMFVSNALADYRLCMMTTGGSQMKIIPAAEAVTMASVVTEEQLESIPDWQWITVRFQAEFAEANALRGALQNMTTRQGGVLNPMSGANTLLICDRADRVKEICATCREIDAEMKPDIRSHVVPAAIELDAAVKGLRELFQDRRMNPPTFTVAVGQHNVVVRGIASLHDEVDAALKAMQ
ncbi:MAG: hypothetical protein KDB90_01695 [Planctomycetes bacterium]|nr:hypothetical protein [Planctomycetota bacterium]